MKKIQKVRVTPLTFQGTGKTYLSACDVRKIRSRKMLFLVHREQILNQAIESFKDVLGEGINVEKLSGSCKEYDADYLFSTSQMMSKDDVMQQFAPDYFDYICLDKTHRSGAARFQRVISYFQLKFMLGMTATPERTDGFDIYQLFDHNIAYEIHLQQAMQVVMLRPTESAIIFIQQLGRGLRKAQDKECVVVIDFIGNYTKNFLIPIALSGDRTFNESEDVLTAYRAQEMGVGMELFVRKNKDDKMSKEFYYLGKIKTIGNPKPIIMKGTN